MLKRLGGGGFGEVFLGEDPAIGRQVAIKLFKPKDENLIAFATSSDEEGLEILRARFLSEAKILASLENTMHVVNVLEYGELDDGSPYYVMPYLPRSLADQLGRDVFDVKALEELPDDQRPRALPMEHALEILEQVLRGLAAAHSRGLIHRDIKPSNIMLTEDDDVRIVDFGIAKAPDGQHSTVSHLGLGSRNYMAPEQRESAKHVDARADVYSVGRLAYRMLTGRLPVGRFADPNVAVPEIGKAMNDVILAALEEDREKRPEDAGELLEQFEAAKSGVGEQTGESDTGTWVGEGEAGIRDELKPLRAKIAEVIAANGRIPSHEKEGLVALAAIADLGENDLDKMIGEVVKEDKTLGAKQRLARSIATRVRAVGGPLDQRALASLGTAAEAVGWDRSKIKTLMDETVAELRRQEKPGSPTSSSGDTFANLKSRFRLPLKPIAAALVALVVLAGIGYGVYEWRQGQLAEAEAERQRQLAEQQEDAAWEEARSTDTLESYEKFLGQWPDGLYQQAARDRITQLEEQGKNIVVRIQDYLNRLGYRVPEGGEAGTRTIESIRDFEEAQGLVVTGTADDVVLDSLIEEYSRRDDEAWKMASEEGSEVAIRQYGKEFPQGRYVDQIEMRVAEVKDQVAWEAALSENTESALRRYAEEFPKGAYADEVDTKIEELRAAEQARRRANERQEEEDAWRMATDTNTVDAYDQYVNNYPAGRFVDDAKSRIGDLEKEDAEAWAMAASKDTLDSYQMYLKNWPVGQQAEAANQRVQEIEELVRSLQEELRRLDREVQVTGELDSRTRDAVNAFVAEMDVDASSPASEAVLASLRKQDRWPILEPGDMFRDCEECPEMVVIPSGSFMMGSPMSEPERDNDESPVHGVRIKRFALGAKEVTFSEWDKCVEDGGCSHEPDDKGWGRGAHPVIKVNWRDAQEYIEWISKKTGKNYRLPTESEWEYAARAGTETRFHTGHCITTDQANFKGSEPAQGCPSGEYRRSTVPVGSFLPNEFGLYDMHGNVMEWLEDAYHKTYEGAPDDGSPVEKSFLYSISVRGGSFKNPGREIRSAKRHLYAKWPRNDFIGFRVARAL
ncbi:SUMF1/EgtB/PvdO family nonheme iron enzyme [Wenzhouxiangella sp. EGI_FJ10305]|uniref:SUMF1/EgtB/PvdO family nonheme iron enzyme n=1 Tax=Wenzhouxiangella sp. EGI_FJ10305 TaxID=3243768 RepID=UPI0035D6A405